MRTLIVPYSEDKKKNFYIWLEATVGKMLNAGMLYYTGENIKKYRNVIGKELRCFLNILNVLRLFIAFSDQKYFLRDVNQKQMVFYIKCLANYVDIKEKFIIDLNNTYLRGADLRGVNLVGSKLIEADLGEANLRGANLAGINLIQADLRETNLARADLSKANLTGSNLIKSDLTSTKLIAAKLRKINATGVNLIGADLTGTDLRESNLAGSNLIGVDLREANLVGVDLREANISSSRWTREDIIKYIDLIKLAKFSIIYLDSKKLGENIELTRGEFLSQYPS